ncbi:MAG: metal-dependent hydrolase [Methanosarcinales archaeon]|nr:metal-dependent hydrolase [Methanosarcinales archaeon]
MADCAFHILLPLLAMFVVTYSEKTSEKMKYMIFLLPLALMPDLDHFFFMHRMLLHNIFIPLIFIIASIIITDPRVKFAARVGFVYVASHIILDMFSGGVALLYPLSHNIFFIQAELLFDKGFSWVLDCGMTPYSIEWALAKGSVITSTSSAAILIVGLSAICILYRARYSKQQEKW